MGEPRLVRAAEVRTGDQVIGSDGRPRVVTMVSSTGGGEIVIEQTGSTTLYAPPESWVAINRASRVIDHDRPRPLHRSQSPGWRQNQES